MGIIGRLWATRHADRKNLDKALTIIENVFFPQRNLNVNWLRFGKT